MTDLPIGTVTFLFTDLEGSTRLWQEHPDAMKGALARHDEILRDAIAAHDGYVVKMTGDGAHAAFAHPREAVDAARDAQRALAAEAWGDPGELRVRMGVHTGPAEQRDGDYFGTAVNRAARVMSAAHGGQVLVSLTTEELLRDSGAPVELVDLGEHRLRDLSTEERLFQLVVDGLTRDFPPLRTLDTYRGNLPPQTTSFVGREAELDSIADALRSSRLVTITGSGGVGKTRLATQVAAELLPVFPSGAWLCELAAASDGDTMLQVVASTLGVRPQGSLQDAIVEYLRSRQALIIVDNCEHLLEDAARMIETSLRGCPEVVVLATSREGLGVPGEQVWPLRSLELPAPSASVDELTKADSVRLFIERASSVKPSFAVERGNAEAVAEICRRLDGVPLAIELAAARVAVMNPSDIAQRLDERFRLLTGGRRTAVERHQTLRATVEWSYSLLSPRTQQVFDRLGVFAGGFDADAVQQVVIDDDLDGWAALDALADLVSKSMVNQEESGVGSARYRMLETLRQYARERLDESDPDEWRRRHAQYYARLMGEIGRGVVGAGELTWRDRLTAESDNLRAALTWALDAEHSTDVQLAHRIMAELSRPMTSVWQTGLRGSVALRAIERLDAAPLDVRGGVFVGAAWSAYAKGDWAQMREFGEAAVRAEAIAPGPAPTTAHFVLASALTMLGDVDATRAATEEAFRVTAEYGVGPATVQLGILDASQAAAVGDLERMRVRADATLAEARRLNHPSSIAAALSTWGWAQLSHDPDAAEAALVEALELYRNANISAIPRPMAASLLARLRAARGDSVGAVAALTEAVVVGRDLMQRGALITSVERGVDVFVVCDRPETAAALVGAATRGPLRAMRMIGVHERAPRRQLQDVLREQLGDERYEACVARGAAMSYEELLDYTLAELEAVRQELEDG
jgi:predicted ATPase/class 3 adenylate cyclase